MSPSEERALLRERIRRLLHEIFVPPWRRKETVTIELYSCERVGDKLVRTDVLLRDFGDTGSSSSITFHAAVGNRRRKALRRLNALGIVAMDDSLKVKGGCSGECMTYTYQLRPDEVNALKKRSPLAVSTSPRIIREPALA